MTAIPALPHSEFAEQVVLGSMIVQGDCIPGVVQALGETGDPFYLGHHRAIFRAIVAITEARFVVDPTTLTALLTEEGCMGLVPDGPRYFAKLEASVLSPGAVLAHTQTVLDKWLLRRAIEAGRALQQVASSAGTKPLDAIAQAEQAVSGIANDLRRQKPDPDIALSARQVILEIEARRKNGGVTEGVATGYPDFDRLTGGLHPTEFVVLAARPGLGKSSLAINIAQNVAGIGPDMHRPAAGRVGVFSLEMGHLELVQRMIASMTRIDLMRLRCGIVDGGTQQTRIDPAAARIANAPILIDDKPGMTLVDLRSKARMWANKYADLKLIIVDYLQLLVSGQKRVESRQVEVGILSRSLKELARELYIPVLCLAQLNRETEKRKGADKRPKLSDLRESGSVEQDANLVAFIHRPDERRPEQTELLIEKNRNGPTGDIPLEFAGQFCLFRSSTRNLHHQPPPGRGHGPDENPF